jgi:16S rRNA (cytidine1402-2'-O)-methyltransferase
MQKGKVYLVPVVISEDTQNAVIPPSVREALPSIRYFLAENVRTARRFLSSLKVYESIEPLRFEVLDKDSEAAAIGELFKPVLDGKNVGILSESGCPGIADPGALAVDFAHKNEIEVVPLVGPSSVLLALMSSGLNGQRFAFQGYLPIESKDLVQSIRDYERESRQKQQTQIFIETPYRNNSIMKTLLSTLSESTKLTVAIDLTGKQQSVRTYSVKKWRTLTNDFPKLPAVFLFLAGS